MTLGEMIRSQREEREMTQQEFAELLHVTRQTVSRWESGSRCPDLIMAKKIADTFGISLDELVSSSNMESFVPTKSTAADIKRILSAIFLLVLGVWFMVYGFASNGRGFAVISMVLVFAASIVFIFGYYGDSMGEN